MAIIGIDLGTTNSLVSVWKDGKIQLVPNVFGEYLTPSVVGFGEEGEVFVGKVAKERLITHPDTTFKEFKRNMGTIYQYVVGQHKYGAEELSAFLLRRLKEDAERFLQEEVTEAVISVPAYFDDDKRCATKNAGRLAGLKVDRIINEPSAVALKHHNNVGEPQIFIVFDFGGGTLDVSLVETFDNMVEIIAVAGDNQLGGKDFNEAIAKNFCEENGISMGFLSGEEKGILLKQAELLKKDLSESNSAVRNLQIAGKEYRMELTNQKLIHISSDLFRRISKPIKKVIDDSEMGMEDIDKIILVGGSSKMPVVSKYIQSLTDIEVVTDDMPDKSIAVGVGIAAAIKERKGEIKDMILSDICPFSLGTEIADGSFSSIIDRNEVLPCKKSKFYVTVRDNQERIDFTIYQGENLMAKDNLFLGMVTIDELPRGQAGMVSVIVTFTYDINGILDIELKNKNKSVHKLIVNSKIGLTEEELEEKVEQLKKITLSPLESEENRFLIEKAERLFQESNSDTRNQLVEALNHFKRRISECKNEREKREEYVRFSIILNALEKDKVQFHEFDESFWNDEETDYD